MFKNIIAKLKHRWQLFNFKPATYERNLYGVSLKVYTNTLFSQVLFGPKRNDWKEIKFIAENLIKPNGIVCDVGANIGFTTMFMSKCAENVIAFGIEPNPVNLEAFYKNIELNNLQQKVFAVPYAAGNKSGEKINLTVHPNSSFADENEKQQTYTATMISLDEYFSQKNIMPDFLKIDVEGAELFVLQGAKNILATKPALAIEIHVVNFSNPETTITSIFNIIDVKRYKVFIQSEVDGVITEFNEKVHTAQNLSKLINVHLFCIPI